MDNVDRLDISDTPAGTVLQVKVAAGASRQGVVGVLGSALKIATSAPPEKGKANAAVTATLAAALGLAGHRITLIAGPSSTRKKFCVEGLSAKRIAELLESL